MCVRKYQQKIGGIVVSENPDVVFKSIEDEEVRTYQFGFDQKVKILDPIALHISNSGGHRVVDSAGVAHYIQSGWLAVSWVNKEGAPRVNF
jgi:hypothetical protein